jgi:SAM-dependent methyltransferase
MKNSDDIALFDEALKTGVFANAARILSLRNDLEGKRVIDLACGDGRTTYLLRKMGAIVSPYDIFPESCKLPDDTPQFADVGQALPIADGSADLVILQEVIEHLPNQLFALQEICRILKPGGELFLTTPNKSSLVAKLSYLCFESEVLKGTPWGSVDGVWGQDESGQRSYYGHLFLIGVQQLRALALIAGFKSIEVKRTDISRSSAALMLIFYPVILLASLRAVYRDWKKYPDDPVHRARYRKEKLDQLKINISPWNLTNKYFIAVLRK